MDYWSGIASNALQAGRFTTLNRMFSNWNSTTLRTRDGRWRLDAMLKLIDFSVSAGTWDLLHEKIRKWKQPYPDLPGPAITEAMYWLEYGWNARGGGYADTVTGVGRQLFRERLGKAEQILRDSKENAASNPLWYYLGMRAAPGLGWSKPDILDLFSEAIDRDPGFYANYFAAVYAMSPKWGGSYEMMDLIAKEASEHLLREESDMIYARVYWTIDGTMGDRSEFFTRSLVSWGRMRSGFDRLIAQYPDSAWNPGNYLAFSCRAGDKESYLKLCNKIDRVHSDSRAWVQGYSPDVCDHMFMENI